MRFVIKGGGLSRVPFSFFVLKKHSKNTVKGKGQIHIEVFVTGVQMCGWGAAIEGPAVFLKRHRSPVSHVQLTKWRKTKHLLRSSVKLKGETWKHESHQELWVVEINNILSGCQKDVLWGRARMISIQLTQWADQTISNSFPSLARSTHNDKYWYRCYFLQEVGQTDSPPIQTGEWGPYLGLST